MGQTGTGGASRALYLTLSALALAAVWVVGGLLFGGSSASAAEPTPETPPPSGILSSATDTLHGLLSQVGGTVQDTVSGITTLVEPVVAPLPQPAGAVIDAVPSLTAPVIGLLSDNTLPSLTTPLTQAVDEVLDQLPIVGSLTNPAPATPSVSPTTTPDMDETQPDAYSAPPGILPAVCSTAFDAAELSASQTSVLRPSVEGTQATAINAPTNPSPTQPSPYSGGNPLIAGPAGASGTGSASPGGAVSDLGVNSVVPQALIASRAYMQNEALPSAPTLDSDTTPD